MEEVLKLLTKHEMNSIAICTIVVHLIIAFGCRGTGTAIESTSTQGVWVVVRGAQEGRFNGLSFSDLNNGWVIGDSGRILHTIDGGDTWNSQLSGTSLSLQCVRFVTSQKGWIGASDNSLGRTTNGGLSWLWQHPAGEARKTFMDMWFLDENSGWVGDNFSGILHTDDGGINWNPQTSGTNWAITSIQFLDKKEGWATATNRVVLHTTDGGNHWSARTLDTIKYGIPITVVFDAIYFVNSSKGWIAASSVASSNQSPSPILSTTDGGRTWNYHFTPDTESILQTTTFLNENMGWVASSNGVLFTRDGGAHWDFQLRSPDDPLVDLCFIDQSHGWALTFEGKIYRYR